MTAATTAESESTPAHRFPLPLEFECWKHRHLLAMFAMRELRVRFAGSRLGAAWALLQPLAMLFLYLVVFSSLMRGSKLTFSGTTAGYAAYLVPGLLAWTWFSEAVSHSCWSITSNGSLLRKVAFPAAILPVIPTLSGMIPFVTSLAIYLIVGTIAQWIHPEGIVYLPLAIALQAMLQLGPAYFLSSATVFFRDLGNLTPSLTQIMFWATPVVYVSDSVAMTFPIMGVWFDYNPVAHLLAIYRQPLLLGQAPPLGSVLYVGAVAILFHHVGRLLFTQSRRYFADEA